MKDKYYFNSGVRSAAIRMRGIRGLLRSGEVRGRCVLDVGCAEGDIALRFWNAGASLVHGVDIRKNAILEARKKIPENAAMRFWVSDIEHNSEDFMLPKYDIVLFLGVYHHLSNADRNSVLAWLIGKCEVYFLIRTNSLYPITWTFANFEHIKYVSPAKKVGRLDVFKRVQREARIR
jgi:2-polyprenyl-3-methyl-5-hydroxy-6-metoxy-1,4-benzoquinol methylase